MYQFTNNINRKAFFWFRKKLIEDMNWAMISSAAKAIYPVIASYVNEKGIAYPGKETIAALAGVDQKTARKGIHDLEGFPGFDWSWYTTKSGKRWKKFLLKLIQHPQRGEAFPFHRAILETGNWIELSPTGKALYIVMRYFAYFDINEYEEGGASEGVRKASRKPFLQGLTNGGEQNMDNHLKRLYNYGNSWPADTIPPEVAGTIGRLETLVILTYSTGDADLFEPVISELERIRDRCKGGRACDA